MKNKILIVDDEVAIVRLLALRLKINDYNVITAHDGYECVEKARNEIPDLILLDIKMPNQGGIQAFQNLKKYTETENIPVIFITAYPGNDVIKQVRSLGAKGIISKPFDSKMLLNKIF